MENLELFMSIKNNNIMVITSDLFRGGVAESTRKILKYLSQKEDSNIFCVIYDDLPITKEIPNNVKIIRLGCKLVSEYHKPKNRFLFNFKRGYGLLKAIWKLRALKKELKIDVAYSMMYLPNIINVITKVNERVLISERQNPKYDLDNKPAIIGKLFAYFYKKADGIHINSKGLGNELISYYGVDDSKLSYFPNFFFPDEYSRRKGVSVNGFGSHLKVLCVGRNNRQKGFAYLPKILQQIKTPIELNVVSDLDPDDRLAKDIALSNTIHRVNFLKERTDINDLYSQNDVFLLTSLWESFGNVVVEAMLSGLPIVCNYCPTGPVQIIQNKWGLQSTVSLLDNPDIASSDLGQFVELLATDTSIYSEYQNRSLERAKFYSMSANRELLNNFFDK